MANILCVTNGLPGMLYSCVELSRRLDSAGHRVTIASTPQARALAEHHRLTFFPLEPSRYQDFLEKDARTGTFDRLLNLRSRRERATESLAVTDFATAVRSLEPDLVLIDGEMHEHIISLSGQGVPLALLNTFASIWKRPGLPPPHRLVRPGVGWLGTRAGISLLWLALRLRKRYRALSQWVQRIGCDRLSVLQHLARDVGFDFRRETDAGQWLMPFTYRTLPALSLHALEFEFPHCPLERVHYVGPMLLESRTDRLMTEEKRAELDAIFEKGKRSGRDRKLIYAGFGSCFSTDLALLRRLLGVVETRPEWDLVISLGDRIAATELGPIGERVHAFGWLPQIEVLQHADAAVTHGGINTIDECVLYGVPLLVYCGFETDMAGTTARVVHHGIGIAGDRRRDRMLVIREHLDRLLHEPQFQRNLNRLQLQYQAYFEDGVAERTVESLLRKEDHERVS